MTAMHAAFPTSLVLLVAVPLIFWLVDKYVDHEFRMSSENNKTGENRW